jgi:ArsR family transcriptional regulator
MSDAIPHHALLEEQPADANLLAETAAFFKVFSDANRLRIFAQLMNGDTCNGELVARLGIPANLLSHHLKVLSEAGLVLSRRDRIDGRWIYYSVNREAVAAWRAWFAAFFDPSRIRERELCGPEGQGLALDCRAA